MPVKVLGEVKEVACGSYWSFAVTEEGEVFGTGANHTGQLGLGHKKSTVKFTRLDKLLGTAIAKVSAGHHTAALSAEGDLFFWGTGVFGEVLLPQRIPTAKLTDISVGDSFGLALDQHGKLWTWSSSTSGGLGAGSCESRPAFARVPKLQDKLVTAVSCGSNFAVALGVTRAVAKTSSAQANAQCSAEVESQKIGSVKDVEAAGVRKGYKQSNEDDLVSSETSSQRTDKETNSLLRTLLRQKEHLEELLEEEKRRRERLEESSRLLSAEVEQLKGYMRQREGHLVKEANNASIMIEGMEAANKKASAVQLKVDELERDNRKLGKLLKDKETELGNANRKYEAIKKKLHHHIEVQEALSNENSSLVQKIRSTEMDYKAELAQLRETNLSQIESTHLLEKKLEAADAMSKKLNEIIKENEAAIISLRSTIKELQDERGEAAASNQLLQVNLDEQTILCEQYQNDLQTLQKEFGSVKEHIQDQMQSLKAQLATEKYKAEDLASANNNLNTVITKLKAEREEVNKRVRQLEAELREAFDRLDQFRSLNEELERRNYNLLSTMQQAVAKRSRDCKSKTLAALAQSAGHKVLNRARDAELWKTKCSPIEENTCTEPLIKLKRRQSAEMISDFGNTLSLTNENVRFPFHEVGLGNKGAGQCNPTVNDKVLGFEQLLRCSLKGQTLN